jgi:hypothetical protein
VADNYLSREQALAFLGPLLLGEANEAQTRISTAAAEALCDICPEEAQMDLIDQAYKKGLINPCFIDRPAFKEALAQGESQCLQALKEKMRGLAPENFHGWFSSWACFGQGTGPLGPLSASHSRNRSSPQRAKAKSKRKAAQNARKKNRRRG